MLKIIRQVLFLSAALALCFVVFKVNWAGASCEVLIFGTTTCPYCDRAKNVCVQEGVSYRFINLSSTNDSKDMELYNTLPAESRRTVPQIFINGEHIGGYSELLKVNAEKPLGRR